MFSTNVIPKEIQDICNGQPWPTYEEQSPTPLTQPLDHFIKENDQHFAGRHLIIDFWGCQALDQLPTMETAMRDAIIKAKATLLHIHLHHFTPNGGISGVAVLAESHISVHTWPECGFAAFDVFMCDKVCRFHSFETHLAIEILRKAFMPTEYKINEIKRGIVKEGV